MAWHGGKGGQGHRHLLQQKEIFSSCIVRKGLFASQAKAVSSPGEWGNRINLRGVKSMRTKLFRLHGGFQRRDGENIPACWGAGWSMQFQIRGTCMHKMSCWSHRWETTGNESASFLILLIPVTLLFLDLSILVSVSILNIVNTCFYLCLFVTWLKWDFRVTRST